MLNWLLAFVPIAIALEYLAPERHLLVFGAAALAILPLAGWLGRATEQLADRSGEGVGGLLCPMTDDETFCDLLEDWRFPLVIVGHLGLGTINHTLLTVEVAMRRGLSVRGILLNETAPHARGLAGATNPQEIAKRCPAPILGVIPYAKPRGLRPLRETSTINWRDISRRNTSQDGALVD